MAPIYSLIYTPYIKLFKGKILSKFCQGRSHQNLDIYSFLKQNAWISSYIISVGRSWFKDILNEDVLNRDM